MNHIYQVIWNKAKHCYIAVSEIAKKQTRNPSAGRGRRCTAAALAAALMVTGGLAFGAPCIASAAEGEVPVGKASLGQYIAFRAASSGEYQNWDKDTEHIGSTKQFNDHNYVLTTLTDPNTKHEMAFWVRQGYTVALEMGKYNDQVKDESNFKIVAHEEAGADEGGLLTFSDVSKQETGTLTVLGDALVNTEAGLYGGAINSAGVDTIGDSGKSYLFNPSNDNKTYRQATEKGDFTSDGVTYDGKNFLYNGQKVDTKNVYFLHGKASVFLDENKNVYTGRVFGNNNEYLVTAYDKDTQKYYSFWAAKYNDPDQTMNVTYRDWEKLNGAIKTSDDNLAKADIKYISLEQAAADKDGKRNGGTLGLVRNTTDNKAVDGAVTVTSTGGTDGKDVQVQFTNTTPTEWDKDGNVTKTEEHSFTVNAGSKVEVNKEGAAAGKTLTHLTVNGVDYDVPQYTAGNGIAISDKNQISVKTGANITAEGGKIDLVNRVVLGDEKTDQKIVLNGDAGRANIGGVVIGNHSDGKNYVTALDNKEWDGTNITSGRAATEDQLKAAVNIIHNDVSGKTFGLSDDKGKSVTNTLDKTIFVKGADGITSTVVSDTKGDTYLEIGLGNALTVGGKDGADGQDGSITIVNKDGTQGTISINGKDGKDGLDGTSITRIEYTDGNNQKQEVATMNDGLRFAGDNYKSGDTSTVAYRKLNEKLDVKGGAAGDLTEGNIGVIASDRGIEIKLAKDVKGLNSITTNNAYVTNVEDKDTSVTNKKYVDDRVTNVNQELTDKGFGIAPEIGSAVKQKLGETISIVGDKNVNTSAVNGKIQIALENRIVLGDELKEQKIVLNGNEGRANIGGVVIGQDGHGSRYVSGLSNQTIDYTGFADGSGRAATEEQLQKAAAGSKTTVDGSQNITVTPDVKEDGHTEYQVKLKDDITLGSGSNSVHIDGNNGNVAATGYIRIGKDWASSIFINREGKGDITGLTNRDLKASDFAKAGRAATEEQLQAAMKDVSEGAKAAHTVVTAEGKAAPGDETYTDGNIQINKKTNDAGQSTYDVKLNNDIKLGDSDTGNYIRLDGNSGNIAASGYIRIGKSYGESIFINQNNNGLITGLSNTTWDYDYGGKTGFIGYQGSNVGATQGQLYDAFSYLNTKIDNIEIKDDSHNTVIDPNGKGHQGNNGSEGGTTTEPSQPSKAPTSPSWTVKDNPDGQFGSKDDKGNITEGSLTIIGKDQNGKESNITINKDSSGTMNGLSNTTWDSKLVDKNAADGGYKGSTNAATESQLQQATEAMVQYDYKDGKVDKDNITLAGGKDGTAIHNVADGEISADSKDAVNGSQLYATNQQVINNSYAISNVAGSVSRLSNRVNQVGAGAAALAALHPLDFDPDDKWDFSAGYGNYAGANAVALGMYYRPNEDTMFSVGGSMGGGENMVNAGVSFKLGQGNNVSTSRVAMAKEIKDLRKELEEMRSLLADTYARKPVDPSKLQLFPDVPANHWAYEMISQMAGNGLLEGYPDGNFHGDRPMTRYEFAAMLYRAMEKGARLSDRLLTEFAPELERFTVDTVAKDKDGNPTIERVRVVKKK